MRKSTKTSDQLKDEVLQGVTYATMKIAVKPTSGSCSKTGAADSATSDESSTSPKATKKKKTVVSQYMSKKKGVPQVPPLRRAPVGMTSQGLALSNFVAGKRSL